MVRRDAATTEAGTTYERSSGSRPRGRPGRLALRELDGGREVSADQAATPSTAIAGSSWRSSHRSAAPGSSLALEVVGHDLAGDGRLLVDGIDLQTE
jgi:hypothetical protein